MNDDTVSRQAAIDGLWSLDIELRPSAIDAIYKMLKDLPHAPRWTPVSERPPKESGKYLVWNDFGCQISDFDSCKKTFGEKFSGFDWDTGKELSPIWVEHERTLAWMPLPEPYREE